LGKKNKDAVDALKKAPLTITLAEAEQIDKAVKKDHIRSVKRAYDAAAVGDKTKKIFDDLPGEAQTVIMSVSFQYGRGLSVATPKFWQAILSQDWKETSKILKAFGDVYPTRRKLEAALLDKIP